MKFVLFYHSLGSCWNHGNAHFLRGVTRELLRAGHQVIVYEPEDCWSRTNAVQDGGSGWLAEAEALVPGVVLRRHRDETSIEAAVDGADVVIVHEWNSPELVAAIGRLRRSNRGFALFFHDTHHRVVTSPHEIEQFALDDYDGVLAFGEVLRQAYLRRGWARRAFTWHEAADVALFKPHPEVDKDLDLIWIGNWGDGERTAELNTFLVEPVVALGLRARIHGVRYPEEVRRTLAARGIGYAGWLPNHHAPRAFAGARATVHVPRGPYVRALPGIPTIRMFEALACGVPLVSAPWDDTEGLFPAGSYLRIADGSEMQAALSRILRDPDHARELAQAGHAAVHARHTCAHRVDELLEIVARVRPQSSRRDAAAAHYVSPV